MIMIRLGNLNTTNLLENTSLKQISREKFVLVLIISKKVS